MICRRGLFKGAMALVGGGAAASVVEALPMDAPILEEGMGSIGFNNTKANAFPDWWQKLDRENHLREQRKYKTAFDPDLQANRSMSPAAKAIIQCRRDKERRSWLEKMREKAEREVGLS